MPRITEYRSEIFLVLLVLIAILIGVVSLDALGVDDRNLIDTDGYMRAVRVSELIDGEVGWFDGWAHRSNAPIGHSMHWTRPMDIAVAAAGMWMLPFATTASAVYWGAALVSPLLLLVLGVMVAWAAMPLVGRHMAWLAGLIAISQPVVLAYSRAGRADHHSLLMVVTVIMVGAAIRLVVATTARPAALAAVGGLAGALLLWVAVEALIWVGLIFAAGAVIWVLDRGPTARVQRMWWAWFAVGVLGGAFIDHGPAVLEAIEYDRISLPHVALGVLAAAFWVVVELIDRQDPTVRDRLVVLAVGVAAGAIVMGILFPGFYGGPLAGVPAELRQR